MARERRATEAQLRTMDDVASGRVQQASYGWVIGGGSADPSTARTLGVLLDRQWITGYTGGSPYTLTESGLAMIRRCWPQWKPPAAATPGG